MSVEVILSICITDQKGHSRELDVLEGGEAIFRTQNGQREILNKTRRDVDDFRWEVEGVVEDWKKNYGEGKATDPGGWMVIIEMNRCFTKYQGCGQYPTGWSEFIELFEGFID